MYVELVLLLAKRIIAEIALVNNRLGLQWLRGTDHASSSCQENAWCQMGPGTF